MGAVLFVAAGILFAPVATRQLGDTDAEDAQIPSVTDGGDGIDQIPFCDPVQINQHQRHELVRRVHMQLKINLARHRHKVRQKRGTLGSYSKIWNQIPMKMDGKIYYMVPYTVQYDYDQKSFAVLEEIIAAIEKATCIRFDRIVDERKQQFYRTDDYIAIVNGKGCHSVIGRHSGKNLLTLEVSEKIGTPKKWHRNTCMKRRIVLHELLHVLGLHHEHQRKDRDKFLEVVMANVKKGKEGNFEIERDHESWGFPYDFESIMNYKYNQFALEASKPVIKVRKGTPLCQSLLGTHQHASEMDFLLVNMLYNCVGVEQAVNAFIDRHFPAKPHHNHHHKHKAALRKLETEIKHIEAMMARLERSRSTHHRHRHRSKIQKIEAKLARLESRKKTQKHSQKLQKMEAKLTLEKKTQGKGGKSKQQQAKNGDKSRPQKGGTTAMKGGLASRAVGKPQERRSAPIPTGKGTTTRKTVAKNGRRGM